MELDQQEKDLEHLYLRAYTRSALIARNILRCTEDKAVIQTIVKTLTALPSRQNVPFLQCDINLIIAANQSSFECVKLGHQDVEACPAAETCTKARKEQKQVLSDLLLPELGTIVLSYHVDTVRFYTGLYLDVLDDVNCWCISKIIDLVRVGDLEFVQISYLNWHTGYDEWIPSSSQRLRVMVDPGGKLVEKCDFLTVFAETDELVQLHDKRTGNWYTVPISNIFPHDRLQIVNGGTFRDRK